MEHKSRNLSTKDIDKIINPPVRDAPAETQEQPITVAMILHHVLFEAEEKQPKPVAQKRYDQYQKMLQDKLYEQIQNFYDLIQKNQKPRIAKSDHFKHYSQSQKKALLDLQETLATHADEGKIILNQCQKIMHVQASYYTNAQSIENYRGTNLRGVSRNGRNNW